MEEICQNPAYHRHFGLPAAILGGGPSLPADLHKIPSNAVMFDLNGHASRITKCHYGVFHDPISWDGSSVPARFKAVGIPILSQDPAFSAVFPTGFKNCGLSGGVAVYFALLFGCNPIYLAGMDCYSGDKDYFFCSDDNPTPARDWCKENDPNWFTVRNPPHGFVDAWNRVVKIHPDADLIPLSGPLIGGLR